MLRGIILVLAGFVIILCCLITNNCICNALKLSGHEPVATSVQHRVLKHTTKIGGSKVEKTLQKTIDNDKTSYNKPNANGSMSVRLKRSSLLCNVMFPECATQFAWAVPMRNGIFLPTWYYRLLGTEESPIFSKLKKSKNQLQKEKEKFDKLNKYYIELSKKLESKLE